MGQGHTLGLKFNVGDLVRVKTMRDSSYAKPTESLIGKIGQVMQYSKNGDSRNLWVKFDTSFSCTTTTYNYTYNSDQWEFAEGNLRLVFTWG